MLADLTLAIANISTNLRDAKASVDEEAHGRIELTVEVFDLKHLERVTVDVAVVVAALLDPPQLLELGQHRRGGGHGGHQLEPSHRRRCGDDPAQLDEDPLARAPGQARRGFAGEREGLLVGLELQLERDPHQAQNAHWVIDESAGRRHPQPPGLERTQPAGHAANRR